MCSLPDIHKKTGGRERGKESERETSQKRDKDEVEYQDRKKGISRPRWRSHVVT